MGLFKRHGDDPLVGSFILNEIRDLRKGMEGRDGELRGEIAAVRDAVTTLSTTMTRSNAAVESVRADVNTMSGDFQRLRKDVDDIQRTTTITKITATSAWDGPKKILAVFGAITVAVTGLVALIKGGPIIVAFLAGMLAV